jgi:hypothetical protein
VSSRKVRAAYNNYFSDSTNLIDGAVIHMIIMIRKTRIDTSGREGCSDDVFDG